MQVDNYTDFIDQYHMLWNCLHRNCITNKRVIVQRTWYTCNDHEYTSLL